MINKILENWKKAQQAGAMLPCPRCGGAMDEKITHNALSRRADIYICPRCGNKEAMEDIPAWSQEKGDHEQFKLPLSHWFVIENVYGISSTEMISEDMFGVTISKDVPVSKEDIDEIMVGALEGGINYWCYKAEVIEDDYFGEYASDQISRGGSLRLYDSENGEEYELTLEKVLKGIKLSLENGYGDDWIQDGRLDLCQVDAIGCDAIVQYGLFGEVIYG